MVGLLWRERTFVVLFCATTAAVLLAGWKVILPAYRAPTNRTYTSGFGYAAVKHRLKIPFEITTALAQRRVLSRRVLGEGAMASQPILVPVIPTDKIETVQVAEGRYVHKGELLAELDRSKAELKERSAQLALATAKAEEERVEIGSAYVLAQERPEKDQIDRTDAEKQLALLQEQAGMYHKLEEAGALPRLQVLDLDKLISDREAALALSKFNLGMSSKGQPQSKIIAANAVSECENALAQCRSDLVDYAVRSPVDGIVERVLIQPGEYNQDGGKPAFVVEAGLWFEAHFDQASVGLIAAGSAAEVFLGAKPGAALPGRVTQVIPIVTYDLGGPELARPIRPSGTGTPEWPATYKGLIVLDKPSPDLVPGMTGFARVTLTRLVLAVPHAAILSMSAGSGIVHVVRGRRQQPRAVTYGMTDSDWTEITSGLQAGEKVITTGQLALQPSDLIVEINPATALPQPPP